MRRERSQTVVERVVVAFECDACGKVATLDEPRRHADSPEGWLRFSSFHGDWGGDSDESHHDHDVCSWPCYVNVVRAVVAVYIVQGHSTLQVDGRDLKFLRGMLAGERSEERS